MTGRRSALALTTFAVCAVVASAWPGPPRYLWNLTPSVPLGLYRLKPRAPIGVTSLVAAAPPEPLATALDLNGYLPRGVPLLKRVVALSGQRVCRLGAVITIDSIALASAVLARDARGRSLPSWRGCHRIADDEIFLMNWDSDDSMDGRYFGVLPRSAVTAAAVPVFTDEAGDGHFVWFAATQ